MLNSTEFELWCARLGLSDEAIAVVNQIRISEPVRAVRSTKGNVHGRYPSRKMDKTIQFESHKNELAFIRLYEDDLDVLEYYDQPSTIKLQYESASGRHLGALHTPDFFTLRTNSAGWEECKMEEHLVDLALKSPNRYIKDLDGGWRCPPGEAYAEKFGFYYRVRSSKEINWTYQRNLEFFEDYYRSDSLTVAADVRALVLRKVVEISRITLEGLFECTKLLVRSDDIFKLILSGEIYVDLRSALIVEPSKVYVYSNQEAAIAYENLLHISNSALPGIPHFIALKVGAHLQWDGKGWTVLNVGETLIYLVSEERAVTEIPTTAFEKLVQDNRIIGLKTDSTSNIHPEVEARIVQADVRALPEANRRYEIIRPYLAGEPLSKKVNIPERTIRRWLSNYRIAKQAYDNGYVALLPLNRSGNATDKLPLAVRSLMREFIETNYETEKQKGKFAVYASYEKACKERGLQPASYKTFADAVKHRPRYVQTSKRQGSKAAYKDKEFYWELTPTTPRHGDWPLHIAHIDHTELDEELLCSLTGKNLGRVWATFLTDAYSRRFAAYLTYDPPSYRSCMMIMRECVRRFGRLPQIVVVDHGKEFSSTYFETLLARYECTKKTRPPSQGRFGSICERLFSTTNTQFIHNLRGNTQIMRNVRQITDRNNPKKQAIWTLESLYPYLREWGYEVYDTIEHSTLGQSPRDAFARGMIKAGERAHRLIPYNEEFRLYTLPTTAKGTAKVYPGRGVKINQIYYWSDVFRIPEIEGSQVRVRFDPFNAGSSFAYVRGKWTECISEYWATLRDRSEREIMIATEEMRRRHTLHSRQFNFTAAKLAHFLESAEAEEALLQQRLADRAALSVRSLIDGGLQQAHPDRDQDIPIKFGGMMNNMFGVRQESSEDSPHDPTPEMYEEF